MTLSEAIEAAKESGFINQADYDYFKGLNEKWELYSGGGFKPSVLWEQAFRSKDGDLLRSLCYIDGFGKVYGKEDLDARCWDRYDKALREVRLRRRFVRAGLKNRILEVPSTKEHLYYLYDIWVADDRNTETQWTFVEGRECILQLMKKISPDGRGDLVDRTVNQLIQEHNSYERKRKKRHGSRIDTYTFYKPVKDAQITLIRFHESGSDEGCTLTPEQYVALGRPRFLANRREVVNNYYKYK